MRRLLPILLILIILLTPHPTAASENGAAFAPGTHLHFEHLTIDDGLSQNAGLILLQDRQGYLWIGTQDGLNRYDGYHLTQFKHDPEKPASLSYNGILALFEDAEGFLWVGTWGGGLNRYDPRTGSFDHYLPDPANPASLSHPVVTDIVADTQGYLWVATLGGLERFEPATGTFTHFRHDPANLTSLGSDTISVILPTEDGKLWIGTGAFGTPGAGLTHFDPATGQAERLPPLGECLASPNVSDILSDTQGNLWIAYGGYAVSGGGIDRYNPQTRACTHFDSAHISEQGTSLPQITDNNITDLLFDRDGGLWAATWSSGVWYMPPGQPGEFTSIRHNPADPESLSNDNTFSLLQDHSGIIWIGTLNSGINKLNPETLQFRTYKNDAANPQSLPSNHVGAFAETIDGVIWLGTWESGLARFDPVRGTFSEYRTDPENIQSISSDLVMSLYADSPRQSRSSDAGASDDAQETLWVGTLGGGLNRFDPGTGQFTRYQNDPDDPSSLLDNQVTFITSDAVGRLWVATMAGLARFDPDKNSFVNYPIGVPIVTLNVVGDQLWIGTWGGGVLRLDLADTASLNPAQANFTTLTHDPANPNSLGENSVWSIHASPDGVLWFGTQGGLTRYNPQTNQFKTYTEKSGLRNSTILGILQDAEGFLWVTTNNGLAKFDRRAETFQIYDKSDGLQSNEFNSNAYFLASTGEMYVGGVSGFSVFDPLTLRDNAIPPGVVISNFSIFNSPQPFDPSGEIPISLNYESNFIAFEFAALDFHAPGKNVYSYKLEGFDEDWIYAGTRNYASYTNLRGGKYTFRVKAANNDGVWNEIGASLPLIVTPPFWQTWPFLSGLLVGAAFLVVAGFQWRVRIVREQNTHLQALVDEQKRIEAELRQSEERFRAVYENAAIGISLVAPDRQVLAVNPILLQMSGYSEAELKEVRGLGITYDEDLEVGQAEFGEVLAGKRPSYQVEKRYVHKDGRIQWMRQTVSSVRDPDGNLLYLVAIAEDIDQQKRALEELRESEARFRAMYNNAAVGMAMMSLDRRIISLNETSARITGYSVAELLNTNPGRLSHPDDIEIGMEQFADLVAGKITQFQMEKRFIRKNGEFYWARVAYSAVPGKDGKPEYLVGLIEDITEEKEAGRTLAESEARFRTLYDSAEMGIVLVDLGHDGKLPLDEARFQQLVTNQRLNPAMLSMFGYTAEELQHVTISSLIYPADQGIDAQQFRQLITGEIDSFRIEKRFVRKDGSVFWGRLTDSLARTADGTPRMVIGIIEDINEERQAKERLAAQEAEYRHLLEQRLSERTAELNQANALLQYKATQDAITAERTRLARDLHDAVTQTLFSTTLIADVLPDIWAMNPEEGKRRLEEVRQLTRGALAEMRTLLVELRPNALVEVPLPTLLRQLTEAMIGRARINIQLNAEGDSTRKLPPDVQVGLYRIAQEALNNVVKHAKASQAVVTLRLSDNAGEQVRGELVRLTVADNGAGFDPSNVTADHLGLKIMRERAEAIGAKFSIYSEPGEGTQISVVWKGK